MTRARGDATPVFLFKEWELEPVFHLGHPGGIEHDRASELEELPDGWTRVTKRWLTACGLTISEWGWEQINDPSSSWDKRTRNYKDERSPKLHLRRDHAEAFARLCERCARVPR